MVLVVTGITDFEEKALMKYFMIFCFCVFTCYSFAETMYVEAKISRIESCKNLGGIILIQFESVSGAALPENNGCSNDIIRPYIKVNSVDGNLNDFEKVMLSIAFTAFATDKLVRVRFDSETNALVSLAFK